MRSTVMPQARAAAAATALGHTSVEVPGWYSSSQPENLDSLCSWPNSGHTVHLRRCVWAAHTHACCAWGCLLEEGCVLGAQLQQAIRPVACAEGRRGATVSVAVGQALLPLRRHRRLTMSQYQALTGRILLQPRLLQLDAPFWLLQGCFVLLWCYCFATFPHKRADIWL